MDTFKETNFISAIFYVHNNQKNAVSFVSNIYNSIYNHFKHFELIIVDDACTDDSITYIKEWGNDGIVCPLTIIHMSRYHGREDAMNAGIDAAIGDFVYEFDSVEGFYEEGLIYEAYKKSIDGNDIVSICPRNTKVFSRLFYYVFNGSSKAKYRIQTEQFRLVTRRAINRVHSSNSFMPYRKAAYAESGLKQLSLECDERVNHSENRKSSLAIDSLILYTNVGFKICVGVSFFMMAITILELFYAIFVYFLGKPIEGWTTTILVLSFGFLGLFFILSVITKYLSLILDLSFRRQRYLVESIEKI